jgi:hypothetical protein
MPVSTKTERKGYWMFKQEKVKKDLETDKRIHFMVGSEEKDHYVIFDKSKNRFSCDCEFFSLHQGTCSHIIASQFYLKEKVKDK